jgi:cell division ATPase FtsA
MEKRIIGLDIGTTKIVPWLENEYGKLEILGVGKLKV